MNSSNVSRRATPADPPDPSRYAQALVALGRATGTLPSLGEELSAALELFSESDELRAFLGDPSVLTKGKRRALSELLAESLSPVLAHFLSILAEQDAIRHLKAVAEAFHAQTARLRKRVSGELVVARPLSAERLASIEAETGRVLGKQVSLRVRIDPSLLGGMLVRVGDFVLDGTVDRRLRELRQRLAS